MRGEGGSELERVAVIAKLRPGTAEQAAELVAAEPPFDLEAAGLERHTIFVAPDEVVFLFEGPGVERLVQEVEEDPVAAGSFGAWGALLEYVPRIAREAATWERPRAGGA